MGFTMANGLTALPSAGIAASNTFTGTNTFAGQANVTDSLFSITDDSDATKVIQFQASGITTATTRTLTAPDASGTLVLTAATQTLTNKSIAASQLTGTLAAAQEPARTGDVTNSAGSLVNAIAANAVTNAQAAQMAANTIKMNNTGSTANAIDGTAAQLLALVGLDTWHYAILTADYTLTSQTTIQKLFNWSTNGALTLPTGVYLFETIFYLTGMSATSGNLGYDLKGGGTATLANLIYQSLGTDTSAPTTNNGAQSGSLNITSASVAPMFGAGIGTGISASIRGTINVTVTGTIIPSVLLTDLATPAVKAGSFFRCLRLGPTGTTITAAWS